MTLRIVVAALLSMLPFLLLLLIGACRIAYAAGFDKGYKLGVNDWFDGTSFASSRGIFKKRNRGIKKGEYISEEEFKNDNSI